ncbi:MAG TPA: hypothetical protein ENI97_11075 [Gammaproteobacteria bacterium]|nr:hypothetical protein [Gammaproteobacteria bacterium]
MTSHPLDILSSGFFYDLKLSSISGQWPQKGFMLTGRQADTVFDLFSGKLPWASRKTVNIP